MKYLAVLFLLLSPFTVAQGYKGEYGLAGVFRTTIQPDQFVYLTFFADGRVRRAYPETGLDNWNDAYQMNLDMRSGVAARILAWGTYHISGSTAEIVFANKDTWTLDISHYPQSITAQGATFYLLDPGAGLRLSGTYRSANGDASLQFSPDGQVMQQGVVANCISGGPHFSYGGSHPSMSSGGQLCLDKPLAGQYVLGFYTLHFRFADGTSPSLAFWGEPTADRTNVRTLYIGNVRYDQVQ